MSLLFVASKDGRNKLIRWKLHTKLESEEQDKMVIKRKTWCCPHGVKEFIENYIFFLHWINCKCDFDIQFNVKIHFCMACKVFGIREQWATIEWASERMSNE